MKSDSTKIKILHLEDHPSDAELVARILQKANLEFEVKLVSTRAHYTEALKSFSPEIILSDHNLPAFNSIEALEVLKQSKLKIPFFLVTGTVSEEFAVEAMRAGADDYILKDRLQRLPVAIHNVLEKFRLKNEQKEAEEKIRKTEKQYQKLIQHLPANIAILDKTGTIISVNTSWKKFAIENGFTGENYGIGENYLEVYKKASQASEEDNWDGVSALSEVISGGREAFSLVYPCHSSTEKRWFNLIVSRENKEADSGIVVMHINVTEQQEAQASIEESEAKYRSFFENNLDGILLTIPDTTEVTAANPAACVLFQMTETEICAAGRKGLVDYEDPRLKLLLKERADTGKVKGELNLLRKDNTRFPAEISSSVFVDSNGQTRSLMIIRDRTEQKKADEIIAFGKTELQKLNNRLLLATRSANMGIWEWDVINDNFIWDEGMHRIYNIAINQFDSIYTGWLACLHPQDRERVNEEIAVAIAGKKEYDTEFRIEWSDSTVRFIKATGIVERDEKGNAHRMVGMNWDVTRERANEEKLRKSETHLSNINLNSADMICSVTEEGKFIHVSEACKAILGYRPDEMIGQAVIDFVCPDDREKTLAATSKLMAGNPLNNFENRYVRKDGSFVSLLWSVRWDANDRIRYGVARDATELKKAEKAITSERKRISNLVTNSPVSMCILKGKDHVFELANAEYLKLSGRKDIIGKTVREVFPEIESQGFNTLLDKVFETGEPFSHSEFLVKIDVDGSGQLTDIYLDFLYQPYFNLDEKVEGIYYFGADVTEQVQSRKRIEDTEKKYRQIVETAQEGIWVIDENQKTTFVNRRMCDLLGYNPEEILEKEIYAFMDEEGIKISSEAIANRKAGKSGRYQAKYITKTKKELWANVSANPLLDEAGRYTGALGMITDITNQKKTLEENEKLARIASLTVNAVIVTDVEGRITWVNKGFERITEYTLAEVVGKKPGQILQGPNTDKAIVKYMGECEKNGQGFQVEILNYSKSGRQYWLDIEVRPLRDSKDRLTGFMAIEQDITERKKFETTLVRRDDQITLAAQIAQLGYWEYDIANEEFTFNDQFYDIFKTTAAAVGGYAMSSARYAELFVHPDDAEVVSTSVKEAMMTIDSDFTFKAEHRIVYSNGEIGFISVHFRVIKDENGRTIKNFGVNQDITERKKVELERLALINGLQNKNKDLQQFSYIVSHNLRAPIAKIMGLVSVLESESEENKFLLEKLTDEAAHLDDVVKDINTIVSARKTSKEQMEAVVFETKLNLVKQVLEDAIVDSKATILADFSGAPEVCTIKSYLYSIVYNLISNAIKYRKPEVPLQIEVRSFQDEKFICLSVKDNGEGIDLVKNGTKVFGLYKRFHTGSVVGKGIGLNLVKTHAESLGGRVEIESELTVGTTFRVYIPKYDGKV